LLAVPLYVILACVSLLLSAQSAATVYLLLYGWNNRSANSEPSMVPTGAPSTKFSILLPARHESEVIGHTIDRLAALEYPTDHYEVLVICEASDKATIEAAAIALCRHVDMNSDVVTFTDGPVSKPHGLNKGLTRARFAVIAVVDAEDDVQPALLAAANAAFVGTRADIVQGPVQLIDHGSRWFSQLNCLEYFFWFSSRLFFHAHAGVTPLAGNTVFFRRDVLDTLGGWDEVCLTEDAEIGLRACEAGYTTAILGDARLATREETPPDVWALLRQRSRWHQGFLQILRKGDWLRLGSVRERAIAGLTLAFPLVAGLTLLLWPLSLANLLFFDSPIWLTLVATIPLYGLATQLLFSLFGLFELSREFQLRLGPRQVLMFVMGFVPFQWLIGISALRAIFREARGHGNWEKTAHGGLHRVPNGAFEQPRLVEVSAEPAHIAPGRVEPPAFLKR
jgi:cellulose synthase/poly-beta-1,6-N-acetylglucosamine synthase-like glycosyltransferase